MSRIGKAGLVGLTAAALLVVSCAADLPPRSYVQTNVVDKALFDGEWYYTSTVIDNRYPSTATDMLSTFPGDPGYDFSNAGGMTVTRIRWVIDEGFLYAFRSYELMRGGNRDSAQGNIDTDGDGVPDAYRGEPLAAFAIESHFDIQRAYNPTTGEEYNVVEENTTDRRWYERRYMRVDWSQNHVRSFMTSIMDIYLSYYPFGDLGHYEPVPMFVQPGSDFPESWQPTFEFTPAERPCPEGGRPPADCTWDEYHLSRFWDEQGAEQLYYMSFVTQEIFTPGSVQDPYTGDTTLFCLSIYSDRPMCTSSVIIRRHAFLKISPEHQYEVAVHEDNDFSRFGFFRIERPNYDSVDPNDPADPIFGETDFLDYRAILHNIWEASRNPDGTPIPVAERTPRPIQVWLTAGFPSWLVRTALSNGAEWGEVFMRAVRVNQGRPIPDEYYRDFSCNTNAECLEAFGADSNRRSTCDQAVHQCRRPYNPFRTPGSQYFYENDYQCYVGLANGEAAPPDPLGVSPHDPDNPLPPADEMSDFDSDRALTFNGSECMLVTHVNSCDANPELPCEERGDTRYQFFSLIYAADVPFLGIATMRGDPITGEFISGDANIGFWDVGWYRTRAMQEYDILTGNLTEEELMTGEDVRGMIDDLGRVVAPVRPLRDEAFQLEHQGELPLGFERAQVDQRWGRAFARAERLRGEEGRAAIYSDRVFNLRGTDVERVLFDNPDTLAMAGVANPRGEMFSVPIPDEVMDRVSPFRTRTADRALNAERRELRLGERGICMAMSNFTDYSVLRFVQDHLGFTRQQLSFLLDRHVLSETLLHEYGHVLGLRHNFTGTVDAANFHPEYQEIVRNNPLPDCTETDLVRGECVGPDPTNMAEEMNYDQNGDGTLDRDETSFLTRAQANIRRARELQGIEQYWTSSLMDYTPSWYHRLVGLGRWDVAAVLANYGGLMEVYDNRAGQSVPLTSADGVRTHFRYYRGGENCGADSDCPFSAGGARAGELMPQQRDAGVFQRCLPNPRLPGHGYCSSSYDDLHARNAGGTNDWVPVDYMFCSDERVADTSECARMDEGASYREIVQNLRENYHRTYFWNNFRRFRSSFPMDYGARVDERIFMTLALIYRHMFYRWASEGEAYRNNTGPLGFYDQYMASVDVMNFFAEVLTQPNVGTYLYWPYANEYQRWWDRIDMGADPDVGIFPLYPGQGKYVYSDYRQGITGIFYLERMGIIYDKFYAMDYLTSRGLASALPYTIDEPYWVNFYDAFPEEMSYLFGNFASDQMQRVMPRVTFDAENQPQVSYMDFWRGDCDYRDDVVCRTDPDSEMDTVPWLNDYSSFYNQMYGAILSLAEFPVYWDATWERQLRVYAEGGVDGVQIVDCVVEPANPDCLTEGVDYVRFVSERFHRSYVALNVEPDADGNQGGNYMFTMMTEAVELQNEIADIVACMTADPDDPCGYTATAITNNGVETRDFELTMKRRRLDDVEGYLRYFLQIQRDYGINTWMGY